MQRKQLFTGSGLLNRTQLSGQTDSEGQGRIEGWGSGVLPQPALNISECSNIMLTAPLQHGLVSQSRIALVAVTCMINMSVSWEQGAAASTGRRAGCWQPAPSPGSTEHQQGCVSLEIGAGHLSKHALHWLTDLREAGQDWRGGLAVLCGLKVSMEKFNSIYR